MSTTFNESYYLSQNPDVVLAISQGFFSSALQHFNYSVEESFVIQTLRLILHDIPFKTRRALCGVIRGFFTIMLRSFPGFLALLKTGLLHQSVWRL